MISEPDSIEAAGIGLAIERLRAWLNRYAEQALLLVVGGFVFGWFNHAGADLNVDSFFVLKPWIALVDSTSAWLNHASTGVPNFAVQQAPFYLIYGLLTSLFGLRIAQQLIIYAVFTGSMFGMWGVLRWLLSGNASEVRVGRLLGAILYVANPFTTSFLWWHQTWMELTWVLVPLIFLSIIAMVRDDANFLRIAALSIISGIVLAPGLPHVLLPVLALHAAAAAFAVLQKAPPARVRRVSMLGVIWVATTAWWLFPSIAYLHHFLALWGTLYATSPAELLHYASLNSGLDNTLRFVGLSHLYQYAGDESYYPWFSPFRSGLLALALYTLPLLALFGSVAALRTTIPSAQRAFARAMMLSWLVGVFLMKGDHAPFGALNRLLLALPLGAAWQHPYDKFALIAVPASCILAALGYVSFARRWFPSAKEGLVFVATAICLVEGWPVFAGTVLPQQQAIIPGAVVSPPPEYERLRSILADRSGHVLQLPAHERGETGFAWALGEQSNNDPLLEYYAGRDQSVLRIATGSKLADDAIHAANEAIVSGVDVGSTLAGLGIGTLVVHGDWNEKQFPSRYPANALRSALSEGSRETLRVAYTNASGSARDAVVARGLSLRAGTEITLVGRVPDAADKTLLVFGNDVRVKWNSPGYVGVESTGVPHGWVFSAPLPYRNRWLTIHLVFGVGSLSISVNGVQLAEGPLPYQRGKWDVIVPGGQRSRGVALSELYLRTARGEVKLAPAAMSSAFLASGWTNQSVRGSARIAQLHREDVGKLSVYETACPAPLVYATTGKVTLEDDAERVQDPAFHRLGSTYDCGENPAVVLDRWHSPPSLASPGFQSTMIRDDMPRAITLRLSGRGRSLVVLNTTYDDGWIASSSSPDVRVVDHDVVNRYANGFLIEGRGDTTVTLRYRGQDLVVLTAVGGCVLFLAAVGVLILSGVRERRSAHVG